MFIYALARFIVNGIYTWLAILLKLTEIPLIKIIDFKTNWEFAIKIYRKSAVLQL